MPGKIFDGQVSVTMITIDIHFDEDIVIQRMDISPK